MASNEVLSFEILAKDAQASAAFARFRRSVDDTSKSVDKSSAGLDKNARSADKAAQSHKSLLGALVGTGLAFAPITAGAAAAGVGVAAFGALAVPSIKRVTTALTGPGGLAASWSTLDNRQRNAALGVQQLGQRYQGLAKALEPQVFQVFNQGLGTANSLLGPTAQLARTSGQGLSDFLAQFQNDSGIQHFIGFLSTQARPALGLLGSDITHLSHTVFALLESFGGAGQLELRALTGAFTALDTSVSFLSQHAPGLTSAGLAIGGIALAMSKLGVLTPVLKITGISSIAGDLSGFTAATKGATLAEKGLLASSTALEAITPFGWAVAGAAALGGLVFWLSRFKSTTDTTIASIEAQNKAQGFNTQGYYDAARALGAYDKASDSTKVTLVNLHTGLTGATVTTGQLTGATQQLTGEQKKLISGGREQDKFLGLLGDKYGLTRRQAAALATTSGVLVDKTGHIKGSFAAAVSKAEALAGSMRKAGAPAGVLGADLAVMAANADQAASSVGKVNTAWDTFLGMSTQLQTAELGVIGAMRQISKDSKAAGASFDGVNAKSISLQQEFSSFVGSTQNVIDSMRTAHASTGQLATVLATDLKPAVDAGALANKAFRTQIFDMAQEAGYSGPNKIGPLTRFIDGNATSVGKAKRITDQWASSLAKLPKHENLGINVTGTGSWSVRGGNTGGAGHPQPPGGPGFAAGGRITAGTTPTADNVLIRASRGETMVSAAHSRILAPAFAAVGVPGYASGGVVGSYKGGVPGLGKWLLSEDRATVSAIATSVAQAFKAALPPPGSIGGGFPGGGSSGPGPAAAQAYALRTLPAYGWGLEQMLPLIALWNQESGWRWNALNASSGAYGIPQSLPASKMAAAGADWLTNPATQIRWGLGYIKGRYGSPAGAEAHERAFNWYGNGLDAIVSKPTLIGVGDRGAEHVKVTPVTPVSRGGSGGVVIQNLNITLAPGHPADHGRKIVEYIRQFEKTSGPGWRR